MHTVPMCKWGIFVFIYNFSLSVAWIYLAPIKLSVLKNNLDLNNSKLFGNLHKTKNVVACVAACIEHLCTNSKLCFQIWHMTKLNIQMLCICISTPYEFLIVIKM